MLLRLIKNGFTIGKCKHKKRMKEEFKKYVTDHQNQFDLALDTPSLKYACWYGKNVSLLNPKDKILFKKIKKNILKNINQLNAEFCKIISEILLNFAFEGDQQMLLQAVQRYVLHNPFEFTEQDITFIEDNFYTIHFEKLRLKNSKPHFEFQNKPAQLWIKEMLQKNGLSGMKLQYNIDPNYSKITLFDGKKKLRIIGIEHSVEWIETSKNQAKQADALILQLQPNPFKPEGMSELNATVERLIGNTMIKNKLQNPYVLNQESAKQYLKNYKSTSSVVYYKDGGVDQLRSLLKHLHWNNKQILLADVTVREEVLQIATKYSLEYLRQCFGFLRLLFINEQGRYLQERSKRGCERCNGHAVLINPINLADERFYPLQVREAMIAKNIHHFLKSTDHKNYCCFIGQDHSKSLLMEIIKLHNSQNWNTQKKIQDLEQLRPKYNIVFDNEEDLMNELNKIALIESVYEKRIGQLPIQFSKHQELYDKLFEAYHNLLYPFPIKCPN